MAAPATTEEEGKRRGGGGGGGRKQNQISVKLRNERGLASTTRTPRRLRSFSPLMIDGTVSDRSGRLKEGAINGFKVPFEAKRGH